MITRRDALAAQLAKLTTGWWNAHVRLEGGVCSECRQRPAPCPSCGVDRCACQATGPISYVHWDDGLARQAPREIQRRRLRLIVEATLTAPEARWLEASA